MLMFEEIESYLEIEVKLPAKIVGDIVCLLFQFSSSVYKHEFGSVFPLLPAMFFCHVPVCRKSFTTGCHCLIVLNICFSEALKKLSPHSLDS